MSTSFYFGQTGAERSPRLPDGRSPTVRPTGATVNPRSESGTPSISLRERLRQMDSQQLADMLLRLTGQQEDMLRTLLNDAMSHSASSPAKSATEPYMVGASPAMQTIFDKVRKFAASNAPVLITGESGTGKELAARAIHERSSCHAGPFVAINCAALPDSLIAAELFGCEKGAFTGATERRIGLLESANGGTIFLDEIGDLPLEQQAHFLRFLQERTIYRVGGTRAITVNARVIVATNVDLRQAIERRQFREDLFYRLNVLSLHVPPLRERGGDLDLLCTFFLKEFAAEHRRTVIGFSDEAWKRIRTHDWPGNIRELIACIRRAIVMADGPQITARDLGLDDAPRPARAAAPTPESSRRQIDATQLEAALRQHGRNITLAAAALGVSRMTVYRMMRRFGLS